ncbi:NACHT domain-containing protein [Nonomuraea sp. NPDC050536]|uniref:NACHT domain-containing protein n=1 Tax=Nonomuraea sp. NPDC050536 TaxID=3364366 RepID=UPI0037C7D846
MRRRPALATVLALPAILLGLAGNLATGSVQIEPWLRGWVWAGVGVLAVLVLVAEIAGRRPAAEQKDAAEALARAVGTQWRREEIQRRVHDPFPLQITWRPAGADLVDHPLNVTRTLPGHRAPTLELAGRLEDVAAVYRGIPSGRLVVFGKAGAGKTILALRLVLDLLDGRDPGGRVPVLFGIARWDPVEQPLEDWMAGQLARDYPLVAGRAAELVAGGMVLPVLDGFDELARERRLPALRALNETTTPLVLTTRPEEYLAAVAEARPVSWAAGIELATLDVEDLAGYLPRTGRGGAWEPVLERMRARPDGPLAEALDTPLLVALARTVYSGGRDPAELEGFTTAEDVRRHLFGAFLPAVYGTRGARWGYRRARSWLGYLAGQGREVAWWDLAARVPDRTRRNVLALAFGAGFGLLSRSWLAFGFAALFGLGLASVDLDRVLVRGATATPLSVLAAHRKGTLAAMAMGAMIAGLEFGALDALMNGEPFWDNVPLGVLLVVSVVLVCSPWGRWLVLARLWLPLAGRLPWALPAFLDDAYRRGVLRQTGAVYEFRHAHVMDYLVAAYAEERKLAAERRAARGTAVDRAFRFASARLGRVLLLVAVAAVAIGGLMNPGRVVIGTIWLAVVSLVVIVRARNTIETWPDSPVLRAVGRDTGQLVVGLLVIVLLIVLGRLLVGLGSGAMLAMLVHPRSRSVWEFLLLAVPLLVPALFTRVALGFAVPVLMVGTLAVGDVSPVWPLVACLVIGLAPAWWSGTARLLAATSLSFLYGGPMALAALPLAALAGARAPDPMDSGAALVPAGWEGFAVWASTALAVALVVVALLRRDRIAAAVAATCFAGAPVWLVLVHRYQTDPWDLAPSWILGGMAVLALVALRWWRRVPTLAYVPAAFAAFPGGRLVTFAGVASIAAVVCAVPLAGLPWPAVVAALAATCCLLPALGQVRGAMRGWARGSGGALVAGAALAACALSIPAESMAPGIALLACGAVVVAAWYRHPVVAAATAYLAIKVAAVVLAGIVALPGFEELAMLRDPPPGALLVMIVPVAAVAVTASLLALLGPARAVARAQAAASVAVLAGVAALLQTAEGIGSMVRDELMSTVTPSSLPGVADVLAYSPSQPVIGLVVLGLAALLAATAARGSSPLLLVAALAAAAFGTMPIGYELGQQLSPWLIFGGLTLTALSVVVIVMVARRVSA